MKVAFSSVAVSRVVVAAIVAALLQLASATVAAHPGDGCNDGLCSSVQCDMAAGNGCGSPCVHAALLSPTAYPADARVTSTVTARRGTGPGLRVPDRPFRPPALS
jgi:hypothetical protein